MEANQGRIGVFDRQLAGWYLENGRVYPWRRKSTSNYRKVVTEILLQRTRADTVVGLYPVFFKRYPSWKALAGAKRGDIEEMLRPIGLWRRRAESLQSLAKVVVSRGGRLPSRREEIDVLPGVGQYVANAIELLVHGRPRPLLDVNIARVLERYYGPRKLADIRYDPYLQWLAREIVEQAENSCVVNWAILDLAALVCKPRIPDCEECPLRKDCYYFRSLN